MRLKAGNLTVSNNENATANRQNIEYCVESVAYMQRLKDSTDLASR